MSADAVSQGSTVTYIDKCGAVDVWTQAFGRAVHPADDTLDLLMVPDDACARQNSMLDFDAPIAALAVPHHLQRRLEQAEGIV